MIKKAMILSFMLALTSNSYAELKPRDLKSDSRIKTVPYYQNDVIPVYGSFLHSTHIKLSPNEKILDVDIGDSPAWRITKNSNSLFVKNIIDSSTNMSVITDKRDYIFSLKTTTAENQLTYQLIFTYPEEEKHQASLATMEKKSLSDNLKGTNPKDINWKYNYAPSSGKDLAPGVAFDDGKFTYFKFSDKKSLPAIFAVDDDGKESLVNYTKDGEYIVLHRVDKRYHLRLGQKAIAIFNDKHEEA